MKPTILTRSGSYFDFTDPENSEICINDIAHALACICRFTGHTKEFYSVAQHSVLMSQIVPDEFALAALLHDAHEAYVGDVSSPLKQLIPDYKELEKKIESAVLSRFGLPASMPDVIKHYDMVMLKTELRDVMHCDDHHEILEGVPYALLKISPWHWSLAKVEFIHRFRQLQVKS